MTGKQSIHSHPGTRKYGDQRFIKDDRSGLLSGWRTGDFVRWDAVELPKGSMDSEFDSGSFAGSFDVSDVMIEVDGCALSTFLMFLFRVVPRRGRREQSFISMCGGAEPLAN